MFLQSKSLLIAFDSVKKLKQMKNVDLRFKHTPSLLHEIKNLTFNICYINHYVNHRVAYHSIVYDQLFRISYFTSVSWITCVQYIILHVYCRFPIIQCPMTKSVFLISCVMHHFICKTAGIVELDTPSLTT